MQLKIYDGELTEKLKTLMDQGLCITINADDPAYFSGYENANLQWMVDNVGSKAQDVYKFCCNGFRAAFIPEEDKMQYLEQVDAAFEQVMGEAALKALKAPED